MGEEEGSPDAALGRVRGGGVMGETRTSAMDAHGSFIRSLRREEAQLIALREILYEGRWDEMVKDLLARKEGKPFVFKLQNRIEDPN